MKTEKRNFKAIREQLNNTPLNCPACGKTHTPKELDAYKPELSGYHCPNTGTAIRRCIGVGEGATEFLVLKK